MSIVNARGIKPESSPGVKPGGEPPVIVGGVGEPGEFVVKGPTPGPPPPLKASPVLKGIVRGQSRRVSVRPNSSDVDRSIREIRTRHLRPKPPVAQPKIHEGHEDSAYVVRPLGWVAQPPNYPPKLGPTPFSIRPKSQKYPIREPKPVVMLEGVIHGAGAGASEELLVVLPVAERGPVFVKIHDFGDLKTYKVELKKL